jgi:RarD protein
VQNSSFIQAKHKGIWYMFLSVLAFAFVNTFVKLLSNFPAHELIFFRSIISLSLCLFALRNNTNPFFGSNKKWLLIRGVAGVTALTLFFVTIQNISLANAVSIQYLSPLFTVVIGIFLLKEKVKKVRWLYFAMAIIGVFVIKGFNTDLEWKYLLIGLASAFFSGIAYNAVRKCKTSDDPIRVVMYFPLIATPIMGIWCLTEFVVPHGIEYLYIALMGIFTQFAQINMTKALQNNEASVVTPVKYLGAIFAVAIGYFMFDESLTPSNIAGIGIILLAVFFNSFTPALSKK